MKASDKHSLQEHNSWKAWGARFGFHLYGSNDEYIATFKLADGSDFNVPKLARDAIDSVAPLPDSEAVAWREALAQAHKALIPFALNPGAVSLSKALGHISREHLLAAKQAIEAIHNALASPPPESGDVREALETIANAEAMLPWARELARRTLKLPDAGNPGNQAHGARQENK